MEMKIDSVKLMQEIRRKLSEKYLKTCDEELKELKEKFGHLKKGRSIRINNIAQ